MQITITPTGTLRIALDTIVLDEAVPFVNGVPIEHWSAEVVRHDAAQTEIRFRASTLDPATFGVMVEQRATDSVGRLHYWLDGLPDDTPLDSFGLHFSTVENVRSYLRSGYHSWDGTFYVEPESLALVPADTARLSRGFALTQLLPRFGAGAVVLGFARHDRFQHTFTFDLGHASLALTVQTLWDRKSWDTATPRRSEELLIIEHPEVEGGLQAWAAAVAAAAPEPPRVQGPPITGWCSWYNLYAYITEANVLEHLRATAEVVRREQLPMRVFQIDDGFTPEMGDWLEVKPQFPRGIKPLLDDIRASGFTPGLWIAPFMVGNRSSLFRDHPDWVVRDRQTGGPLPFWRLYSENRWHKRSEEYYILDTTNPDAMAYLRQVFHVWRHDWGCEYFKIDFFHWGAEYGPDRAIHHTPGLTRIEIWRRTAEMIRATIGDAEWLACGCPLWPAIGLVEGIRIGGDVGVSWKGHLSPQSLLRDQTTRAFANHILWQIDPDCVLLRERFHQLTDKEIVALAIFAGMSGGVMMTSDKLDELGPQRLRLWNMLLSERRTTCRYPLLGSSALSYLPGGDGGYEAHALDSALVQVRDLDQATGLGAIFIFNVGERPVQRTYPLSRLGLPGPLHVYDWTNDRPWPAPVAQVAVQVAPHDGVLLFVGRAPIQTAPERLSG